MFRQHQRYVMIAWLGLPIAFFFVLMLINPAYEGKIFLSRLLIPLGLLFFGIPELINFFVLALGFTLINRNVLDPGKRPRLGIILQIVLSLSTFILFTFPALCVVFFWPSVTILMLSTPP